MPASHKTKIAIGKCHRLIEERTNLTKFDASVLMSDILKILEKDWVLEARQETADTILRIVNNQLKGEKIDAKFKLRKITNKGVEVSAVIGNRMLGEDETSEEDKNGRAAEEKA